MSNSSKYLFPVKAMAKVYRAIFIKELKYLDKIGAIELPNELKEKIYKKKWVVYAKRPFASPNHVIEYLGRYTHKVAISNHRLLDVDHDVTFKWKDYRNGAKVGDMSLTLSEFIRRFALHILPHKFVRIRHYGILSFHGRSKIIPKIQIAQNFTPIIKVSFHLPNTIVKCSKCQSTDIESHTLLPTKSRSP